MCTHRLGLASYLGQIPISCIVFHHKSDHNRAGTKDESMNQVHVHKSFQKIAFSHKIWSTCIKKGSLVFVLSLISKYMYFVPNSMLACPKIVQYEGVWEWIPVKLWLEFCTNGLAKRQVFCYSESLPVCNQKCVNNYGKTQYWRVYFVLVMVTNQEKCREAQNMPHSNELN